MTLAPTAALPGRPRPCRLCGGPLGALEARRGDVCAAIDCRRRAAEASARARREQALEAARADAADAWRQPALRAAPVLWLQHHADDLAPPPPEAVAALRAHLAALASRADEADAPLPAPDPSPAGSAADAHLCTLCRGRCCRLARPHHAFLAARHLRGWLATRPDATWADAVAHYLGHVPPRHLQGGCLFHAEHGCTLPRERRSEVCNGYACESLVALRGHAAETRDADAALAVVGVVEAHDLRGAAVVSARALRELPVQRSA